MLDFPSFPDVPLRARALSLVDDDPFARLCDSPAHPATLAHVPRPRPAVVSPQAHVPAPADARPTSSGHGQVRPAHTRPAFAPRPSLPSLHTLAQTDVSLPGRKIRKGTPGARLPPEPWNMDLTAEFSLLARKSPSVSNSSTSLQTGSSGTRLASREIAVDSDVPPPADETTCSRSSSGDDADMDSLPSLSYTTSEPSSTALSRSPSVNYSDSSTSAQPSTEVNSPMDGHDDPSPSLHVDHVIPDDDDPLSYHSDFDYYTQSFSDLSDSESDLDTATPAKPARRSPSLDPGITPYSSLYDPLVDFQRGSTPDTMRRVSLCAKPNTHVIVSPDIPQDGGGWRGHLGLPERQRDREDDSRSREANRPNQGCSGGRSSDANNGNAEGDDNNGDRAHRAKPLSLVSTTPDYTSSSSSSSDDDADGITVYYSLDGMSNGPRSRTHSLAHSHHSKAGCGSDDDIPLAQRVPTALSAQKSIRKQLHDERQQRRLERAKSSRRAADPPLPSRPTVPPSLPPAPSRFRKRSISAAPVPSAAMRTAPAEAFPVEDLTRKLMNLQACSRIPPKTAPLVCESSVPTSASPWGTGHGSGVSRSSSRGKYMDHANYLQHKAPRVPDPSSQGRPLRSMRSFHRLDARHPETQRSPTDQTSPPRLARSATTTASSRTARAGRDHTPATYEQYPKSARVSEEGRRPSATIPRASVDRENDVPPRAAQRPPVPPLPISDSTPPQLSVSRGPVVQQRIFIGDMQRFNMVEIAPSTRAGDVIDTVARQGMLDRSGSWMVFELAQDYGMERPIRDYELLADVSASWNKDKLLNAFIIKQTPLAPFLCRSALPTSSPTYRGWVEWESKRGKWTKRWLELREHGLWLSKREMGKDEVFLCSLSNFDAYLVTRRHKSPKGFVFGIKSTDHLSMFENAADYLHVFCCNPCDGDKWMQAILVARSYVLFQERNVLFTKPGDPLPQAKPLARSRTRKQSISRPAQPLINVPPPFSQAPTANIAFEPGSLLAKRKEIAQL